MTPVSAKRDRTGALRSIVLYGALALLLAAIILPGIINRFVRGGVARPHLQGVSVGQPAPPFILHDLVGLEINSTRIHRPIFLDIFAAWCNRCQNQVPTLNALRSTYKNQVAFVAVSGSALGQDDKTLVTESDLKSFVKRYKFEMSVNYDRDLTIATRYMFEPAFPTYVIIGKNGTVAWYHVGEASRRELADAIRATL